MPSNNKRKALKNKNCVLEMLQRGSVLAIPVDTYSGAIFDYPKEQSAVWFSSFPLVFCSSLRSPATTRRASPDGKI